MKSKSVITEEKLNMTFYACQNLWHIKSTWVYQKVSRLVPQTANQWQYMNACPVLGSREHRNSVC
jgi:hypothetical protein